MTYTQITLQERYAIWTLRKLGHKPAAIARELGRHRSSIGREVRRNIWRENGVTYPPRKAQSYTNERRRVARRVSQFSAEEWAFVEDLLREDWSPEQIEGWCARFRLLAISHETIYRRILRDRKRGGMLWKHLRVVTKKYRKRYGAYDSRGRLAGKRHISTRPPGAEHRSRVGHWEGDTVLGNTQHHACVVTLVERKSGFIALGHVTRRGAPAVTHDCASSSTRSPAPCARSRSTTGRSSTPIRSSRPSSTPRATSRRRTIRGNAEATRTRTASSASI